MHVLSRSCMASLFPWWWSLPSCFCANLWISLDTTSNCRSLWRSLFLIYQGALTMCLSTLFWNLSIIFILLCLVQPHSWIPYVHTGFSMCSKYICFHFLQKVAWWSDWWLFFHVHTVHLDNYQSFFFTNWCTIVHQLVKKLLYLLMT